jgi:hypothetical protein
MTNGDKSIDEFEASELPVGFPEIAQRIRVIFPEVSTTLNPSDDTMLVLLKGDKTQAVYVHPDGWISDVSEPGSAKELRSSVTEILEDVRADRSLSTPEADDYLKRKDEEMQQEMDRADQALWHRETAKHQPKHRG